MHESNAHHHAVALSQLLKMHDLPARWRARRVYTAVLLHDDFAERFLALWRRWREDDDTARCERLHVIALGTIETLDAPPAGDANPLIDAWPMRVPGMHRLEFDEGRVTLTLAIGAPREMLPRLWARVNAFDLDSSLSDDSKYIAKALARLADDNATVHADASWRDALKAAGFEFDGTNATARFAPRWRVRRHEPPLACEAAHDASTREAIVIGAGLAGCAVTSRLAARGWRITLIDRHASAARDASGNPAGVFHPIVWRDDSVAARLTRAGFLSALREWRMLEDAGHDLNRTRAGLLQIADTADDAEAMASAIARFRYPRDYVQAMSGDEAARVAGIRVTRAGWFFPRGGAISPAAICAAQLAQSRAQLNACMNTQAARIEHDGVRWHVFDANDREIASAPVVVLANAQDAARLAKLHGEPTRNVRGQLTLLDTTPLDALRVPVIGEGYAVPLGARRTLIGATYDIDDADGEIRETGHIENIERLAPMLPDAASISGSPRDGRVAFRCVTSDRMPMIGQLADETAARRDAARLSGAWPLDLPRAPGLYGAFALGSRGLVWAALAAELIASQMEGEPWPVERELAEAVDPARFLLRALRHGDFT